ncbi:MAG: tRNA (adenosine(37)-N6)-dimethylallyltransferase MiaA [Bacilli bacterium]|nr:tRNA (adenosine(37)-N6)-dimethylallyltransferase MiaA [Bacilli bacterium]
MIIVITGPTCTNKSKIAIDVAKAFDAEIVNADAFQVYQELDIGTAKPNTDQLKQVKHHLYSYLKANANFSIYDYQKDVRKIINSLLKKKKNVVLVGGSGLYIRAALYDYKFEESTKKADLSKFAKLSNDELHKQLEKIDLESAKKIHPNNRRRVLRALEIYYTYGKNKTTLENEQKHQIIYDDVHIYATNVEKDKLYERINNRVIKMIEQGLINEALTLEKKYGKNIQSLKAIGYKEIIENKNKSKKEIVDLIQKNTRHYAKRQLTFIRYQYQNNFKWIASSKDVINDLTNTDINSRTEALIGKDSLKLIKRSHVAIFGIGGVGGTAAEALVRSGVGNIYLIDHDVVNASNLNRQILFTNQDLKQDKVKVAKMRFNEINPQVKIHTYKKFFAEENIKTIPFDKFDYVIDAIDSTKSKVTLIKYLLKKKIPFISSLGMGNRLNPNKLVVTTLDKTHDDPLAKKLRNEIKKDNIDITKIKVVTSNEIPLKDRITITSMMFVPSTAGLLLASYIIECILKKEKNYGTKKD